MAEEERLDGEGCGSLSVVEGRSVPISTSMDPALAGIMTLTIDAMPPCEVSTPLESDFYRNHHARELFPKSKLNPS